MRVILGIGNHGKEYVGTRHNIGFMVVDSLAQRYGCTVDQKQWKSLIAEFRIDIDGELTKVLLIKPQTYVNLSGGPAQAALAFYKIPPENLLVITDDLNLPLGTRRLREKGSHGGHNGLRDIGQRIGSNYHRLRIGIGGHKGDQVGHVLGTFSPEEQEDLSLTITKATDCAAAWLCHGAEVAMRQNGPLRPPPPKPKKPRPPATPEAPVDEAALDSKESDTNG